MKRRGSSPPFLFYARAAAATRGTMNGMTAWFEISLQGTHWVPLAGWDRWETTRDLTELEPGVEVLTIESMSQEHRVRAAALLLSHAPEAAVLDEPFRTRFEQIAATHCGLDLIATPQQSSETEVLSRLRVAHRVLAHTPLCEALLRQASLITPHITDDLVEYLTCSLDLSSPVRDLIADLRSGNDALALRALRNLAHLNKVRRSSLLDVLLCDGVLLHDALTLQERVTHSSR